MHVCVDLYMCVDSSLGSGCRACAWFSQGYANSRIQQALRVPTSKCKSSWNEYYMALSSVYAHMYTHERICIYVYKYTQMCVCMYIYILNNSCHAYIYMYIF